MATLAHPLTLVWKRALPLAFLAIGIVCQGLVAACVAVGIFRVSNRAETITLIALVWGLSVAAMRTRSPVRFGIAHGLRALFIALAIGSLRDREPLAGLLLALPFVIDSAIYLRAALAAVASGAMAIILAAVCASGRATDAGHVAAILAALLALAVASALAIMMTWYREMVVSLSERSERLGLSLLSLEAANRSYQEYAERVERLSEDKERNRITREIHDTIGYALTNIGMMLQACKAIARKDFKRLEELLDLAREQAKTALQESRNILYKLRVTPREAHYGLAAVQRLARSLRDATGLDVDVSFGNITEGFGPGVDSAVFRLVQEGITNAIKHGTARQIRISYWLTPEGLTVRIWDDGEGSAEVGEGIGLAGMRERFAAFGGSVEAGNALNGFALSGFIPAAVLGREDGIPEEQDQNPHRR